MSIPPLTPPAKRLKTDSEPIDIFTDSLQSIANPVNDTILTVRDISFQTPLRKKLTLQFTPTHVLATTPNTGSKVELSIELLKVMFVICTTAPDKTAKTYNFVILYSSSGQDQLEGVVFGVSDIIAKTAIGSSSFQIEHDKSYKDLLIDAFAKFIPGAKGVIEPSVEEFSSPLPSPGRPKDTAFHITTFRGAKEGYLYLLNRGIFYGFRKPLLFWRLEDISEVTFQDVLARTFSLNIKRIGETGDGVEFGMIDHQCFEGVSAYVHRNGLRHSSLSEARRSQTTINRIGQEAESESQEEAYGELNRAVREYEEEFGDREEKRRLEEFEQAEKRWDESQSLHLLKAMDNGDRSEKVDQTEVDTSDDEELDATFERGSEDDDDGSATSDSSEDTSQDEDSEREDSEVEEGSHKFFGRDEE